MAILMTAKEIIEELGISKTLAYQIMEKLNREVQNYKLLQQYTNLYNEFLSMSIADSFFPVFGSVQNSHTMYL